MTSILSHVSDKHTRADFPVGFSCSFSIHPQVDKSETSPFSFSYLKEHYFSEAKGNFIPDGVNIQMSMRSTKLDILTYTQLKLQQI